MFRTNKPEQSKIAEIVQSTKLLLDRLSENKAVIETLARQDAPNDSFKTTVMQVVDSIRFPLQNLASTLPSGAKNKIPAPVDQHIRSFLTGREYASTVSTAKAWKMHEQAELSFWRNKLEEEFYVMPKRTALLGNPESKHYDHPKLVYQRLMKLDNPNFQKKLNRRLSRLYDEILNCIKYNAYTLDECPAIYQNQMTELEIKKYDKAKLSDFLKIAILSDNTSIATLLVNKYPELVKENIYELSAFTEDNTLKKLIYHTYSARHLQTQDGLIRSAAGEHDKEKLIALQEKALQTDKFDEFFETICFVLSYSGPSTSKFLLNEIFLPILNSDLVNDKLLSEKKERILGCTTGLDDIDLVKKIAKGLKLLPDKDYYLYSACNGSTRKVFEYLVNTYHLLPNVDHLNEAAYKNNLDVVKYMIEVCKIKTDDKTLIKSLGNNVYDDHFSELLDQPIRSLELAQYLITQNHVEVPSGTFNCRIPRFDIWLRKYQIQQQRNNPRFGS